MNYPFLFLFLGLISFLAGWYSSQQIAKHVTRKLIWEREITLAAMAQAVPNGWSYAWDEAEMHAY